MKFDPPVMQTKFFRSYVIAIAVRHVFEPTDDGVFDPEEHRRLADDFPAESFRVFEVSLFIAILTNKLCWGSDFKK